MVKIRLARHGKKHHAYYHIVVADSRSPRDGRYIEVLGKYDPNSNPATILLDNEKALAWLNKGAQPTDTTRAILSYKGVMFEKHLKRGIAKGLLTEETAAEKLQLWLEGKNNKIEEKRKRLLTTKEKEAEARLAEEKVKKEAIAEKVRIKNTPPPMEEKVAEVEENLPEATLVNPTPAAENTEGAVDAPAAE